MNLGLLSLELGVIGLALVVLLVDLWTPRSAKHWLGYLAAVGLLVVLAASFCPAYANAPASNGFSGMFVHDGLALFFKRIFLAAGVFVVLMGVEFRDRIPMGLGELFTITLIALAGMMFAASANDFVMVFVSVEMMSVSFYVLVSFQRSRENSLEAGVKYLILSALSAGIMVFGIALIYGVCGRTGFAAVAAHGARQAHNQVYQVFLMGTLLVLLGLAFKIAAFPMQMWAPDVYQGAPTPVTAFLAIGSKAAGFALALRVLFVAAPMVAAHWNKLFIWTAAITILYGNLCAIPQRSLKRLLGYSSIANAGYVLLGVAAHSATGSVAVLYYLAGYAFTLAVVFLVLTLVARDNDDIGVLAGLNRRSPILALALTLGMISLAGLPPLAGFFGKLLLFQAILAKAAVDQTYLWLALAAIAGVIISLYYYFGVIRAVYWSEEGPEMSPIAVSAPMKLSVGACILAMFYLGVFPDAALSAATDAVKVLRF